MPLEQNVPILKSFIKSLFLVNENLNILKSLLIGLTSPSNVIVASV